MVVGTARLVFAIPSASSLKDKRSVVRRVIERARAKFNAAVAEVEDQDVHRRAVIALAVVSSDARHATSMIDTIVAAMASSTDAQIVSRKMSVQRLGEHDFDAGPAARSFGPGSPGLAVGLDAESIRLPGERDPWDDQDPDDR